MKYESPQYERLVRVKDAQGETRLVPERELHTAENNHQSRPSTPQSIPQDFKIPSIQKDSEDDIVQKSRRAFLIGAAGVTVAGVTRSGLFDIENREGIENVLPNTESVEVPLPERLPFEPEVPQQSREEVEVLEAVETPRKQLERYGAIKNLEAGIRTYMAEHSRYLTKTRRGRVDMETAVENMGTLNMQKFIAPFIERGLPQQLAYMIAIQETRGRKDAVSSAGARGITGIMPVTLRLLGFHKRKPQELTKDPYFGSVVAASHLDADRKIFGDDIDLLLHSYNGGAHLFGFSQSVPKEERTVSRFYAYMEDYLNKKFAMLRERGWYEYRIQKGDTLSRLSDRYAVSIKKILAVNEGLYKDSVLRVDDTIRIPIRDATHALDTLFRSEFEVLHYAPQMRAKYEALKELGLLSQLEAGLKTKTSSFG